MYILLKRSKFKKNIHFFLENIRLILIRSYNCTKYILYSCFCGIKYIYIDILLSNLILLLLYMFSIISQCVTFYSLKAYKYIIKTGRHCSL